MQKNDNKIPADLHLKIIAEMLEDIQYGSITIIVQDGRVIQIDKNEKYRIKN